MGTPVESGKLFLRTGGKRVDYQLHLKASFNFRGNANESRTAKITTQTFDC